MTFEYTLTLKDIHVFWLYGNRHLSPLRRVNQFICGFLVLLGVVGIGAAWWVFEHLSQRYATQTTVIPFSQMLWDWGKVLGVGIVGVSFLITGGSYWRRLPVSLWQRLQKQSGTKAIQQLLGPHELTITSARYIIKTATSERQQDWGDLDSVYLSDAACYLFISPHEAIIVPRRGIEPAMEWLAFCERIRMYTASLNTKASPEPAEVKSDA
jgi:hypothetical protein